LDFHNVVFGDEGVNFFPFHVNETSVLELSAQVQLQFDLKFIFQDTVNPLFHHVLAHGVVELVLEGLVLEVELNLVTVLAIGVILIELNQTEVNLDGAFWDGLGLVGLGELNLVEQNA